MISANKTIAFIEQYMTSVIPYSGIANINLYKYQKELIHLFENHPNHVINKSRQVGYTFMMAHYLVAAALSHHIPLRIGVVVPTPTLREDFFDEVVVAYENIDAVSLGYTIVAEIDSINHASPIDKLSFENGSEIYVFSHPSGMRGLAFDVLVMEEFDFFSTYDQADLWISSLATIPKLHIISSTPGALAGTYAGLWKQAINTNGSANSYMKPSILLRLSAMSTVALIDPLASSGGSDSKDPQKAYDYAMKGI